MILADNKQGGIPSWIWKVLALGAFLLLAFGLSFFLKGEEKKEVIKNKVFLCGAEKIEKGVFLGKNGIFKNGKTQSDEKSRSGNFSSKAKKGKGLTFAIAYDLENYIPGEVYKITVWKHEEYKTGSGVVAVKANDYKILFESSRSPVEVSEGGWEKLQLSFTIPDEQIEWIKIETYSDAMQAVYFDDLRIELVEENQSFAEVPELKLDIKEKAFQKIKIKRRQAFSDGLLITGEDDWVKGEISDIDNPEPLDVKLRLKGDWLDHLKGDKWSFRVKVKDPNAWKRLKTFSLQTPAARYYLHEWAFHKCLDKEDILNTRYDFLQVRINEKAKGVYAYEEHFEKQLVESKRRREGPIVKFSEDGFWDTRRRFIKHLGYIVEAKGSSPTTSQSNADIRAFREKQTIGSETLKSQFEVAQNLMYQYMNGLKPASSVFDVERLAKYMALCEAFQALHGVIWHNQRFYYNPVTQKLEPIGFDGFSHKPVAKYYFLGMGASNVNHATNDDATQRLFLDKEFSKAYVKYLYKFTSRTYLNDFFNSIEGEAVKRLKWLENEYPDYEFKPSRFIELAQIIHLQIEPYAQSLKIFTQSQNNGKKQLELSNIHHLPIEVIGYGTNSNKPSRTFGEPIFFESQPARSYFLRAMHPDFIDKKYGLGDARNTANKALQKQELRRFQSLEVPDNAKYIFFTVAGLDKPIAAKIMNWKAPLNFTTQQELFENLKIESNELFEIKDNVVAFKKGKHQVSNDILIPENYKVFLPEGLELDLINKAKFLSKSPVFAAGTKAEPILIKSSDKSANGFTVLSPQDSCILKYVNFSNLNTLNYKDWKLTGAVTLYETKVAIENCTFDQNHCEDGLNIIRSEFVLKDCVVSSTYSDGFDADFCNGSIYRSKFLNTGNDGMDFSGSYINIYNCLVDKTGDKGISVGEESEVNCFDTKVLNSVIGVASKDNSILAIENLFLENCDQGFTAYQKKPEFGPARILVKSYESNNLRRLYQIGTGCSLQLPGKELIKN